MDQTSEFIYPNFNELLTVELQWNLMYLIFLFITEYFFGNFSLFQKIHFFLPPSPHGPDPKILSPGFNRLSTIALQWKLMYVINSLFLGFFFEQFKFSEKLSSLSHIDRTLKFFSTDIYSSYDSQIAMKLELCDLLIIFGCFLCLHILINKYHFLLTVLPKYNGEWDEYNRMINRWD